MAIQIETIIKDNLTYLNPAPVFKLASRHWFNLEADNQIEWPVCLMDNDVQEKIEVHQYTHYSTFNITLMILDRYVNNDPEGLEHDPAYGGSRYAKVAAMRSLAEQLIIALTYDTRIGKPQQEISDVQIASVYNVFDANLDGVVVTFSIRMLNEKLCFARHDGPKV